MRISGAEPDRGELGHLLQQAGSAFDPEAVEALIDGVLAAPAEVGTGWHTLVADPMTPELADALEALRAAKAKAYHNGLGPKISICCRAPRGSAVCARSWQPKASTGSSCRAPTSIRANTFRPAANGSPG